MEEEKKEGKEPFTGDPSPITPKPTKLEFELFSTSSGRPLPLKSLVIAGETITKGCFLTILQIISIQVWALRPTNPSVASHVAASIKLASTPTTQPSQDLPPKKPDVAEILQQST